MSLDWPLSWASLDLDETAAKMACHLGRTYDSQGLWYRGRNIFGGFW